MVNATPKMVQVILEDELFWVRVVEDNPSKPYFIGLVSNITVNGPYMLGDRITIDRKSNTVLGTLSKSTLQKYCIDYRGSPERDVIHKEIVESLTPKRCLIESVIDGLLFVGVPPNVNIFNLLSTIDDIKIIEHER